MLTQALANRNGSAVGADGPLVIHVVDDETSIQNLFRQIGRHESFEVRSYTCAADFLRLYDERSPGCIVLDLNLPDMTGLQVLAELARTHSQLPVVFMSGIAKVSEAVSALKLGSIDFVEKPFDIEAMLQAVKKGIDKDLARRNAESNMAAVLSRFAELTPREREVMELVVQGLPNKNVAAKLGVSPKTVEVHRANVMRKTGAGSLAELVRLRLATK